MVYFVGIQIQKHILQLIFTYYIVILMKTENIISIYSDQIDSAFYRENPGPDGGENDDPWVCSLKDAGKISFKKEILIVSIFLFFFKYFRRYAQMQ